MFGRNGSSVHVQAVVAALRRLGTEVELFAARRGGEPPAGLEGVRVERLPRPPKHDPAIRERAALRANATVEAALERRGPFDLVYERHALWSYAGMEHARRIGVPGLLEVNAPLVEEQARHRTLIDRSGAELAAARAFRAASALLAVSDGVAEHLNRLPSARGNVHVLANGVEPERFTPCVEREERPSERPFTVGFVGTLKPWHGLENLVEAFGALAEKSSARLLVVGDGPERPALEEAIGLLGVAHRTELTGAVAPAEVPGLLRRMDAAVAPYPDLRPFYFSPLKLFEYMAAGLAVVASRVGQVSSVLAHEQTGLLCPPGDAAALSAALRRLEADPALARALGRAARARALERHTWEAVARRILDLARRPAVLARSAS